MKVESSNAAVQRIFMRTNEDLMKIESRMCAAVALGRIGMIVSKDLFRLQYGTLEMM